MDAPKKIWAWVDDLAGIVGQSEAPETPPNLPAGPNAISPCAEYILASDHARIVAEKDAEIARLRNDCRILLAQIAWLEECTGEGLEGEDAALVAEIAATVGDDNG